jgi:hypothetical protein
VEIDALTHLVARILERYRVQNGLPQAGENIGREIGRKLGALIHARGLPQCLRPDEMGEPGELSAEEVEPLVRAVVGEEKIDGLENAVRQLVKASFYPEFKKCRDSYREVEATGICRRQILAKVRTRVSGAHCVDCPYWTGLNETQHEALLGSAWVGDRREFEEHRELFLPNDFREFRRLIRRCAGSFGSPS